MWFRTVPPSDLSASEGDTSSQEETVAADLGEVIRQAAHRLARSRHYVQPGLDTSRLLAVIGAMLYLAMWVRDFLMGGLPSSTAGIPGAIVGVVSVLVWRSYRAPQMLRFLPLTLTLVAYALFTHMVYSAYYWAFTGESVVLLVAVMVALLATLPYTFSGRWSMGLFVAYSVSVTALGLAGVDRSHTDPLTVLVAVGSLGLIGLVIQASWISAHLRLAQAESHRRVIVNSAPIVMFAIDVKGRVCLLEGRGIRALGVRAHQVIGTSIFRSFDHAPQLATDCRRALNDEAFSSVVDAAGRFFEIWYAPVHDVHGAVMAVIGVGVDVTDRNRAERALREREVELRHRVFHDTLTGLANREMFVNRLDEALFRAARNPDHYAAVLFLDLDRFKNINDSLGHQVGDGLLRAIARRLETCLRPSDLVARLGGDEFTILLENIEGVEDASRVAERIQEALKEPFKLGGHEVVTTCSIGITQLRGSDNKGSDEILREADTAMYRAKSSGKASHRLFDDKMHEHAMALLTIESDLRLALEREQFFVVYQPIVSLSTGRIIGFEALARWYHPERGLVSPAQFIPVAEEAGLIVPLGEFVLNRACHEVLNFAPDSWSGDPLRLHVNLSPHQFTRCDLLGVVDRVLSRSGLPATQLALEITETLLMENVDEVLPILNSLRERGIGLSVDDFGTGYSSLGYLHKFPIDTLKIDRSFVGSMQLGREEMAIVQSITSLARTLQVGVIAEGVETPEQLQTLRELGCHAAQGHLFARALLPERARDLLHSDVSW